MDDLRKLLELRQYKNDEFSYKTDVVIREKQITININGERLTTLAALPQHLNELAVGYLYSEGLIKSASEIHKIDSDFINAIIEVTANIPKERLHSFRSTGTQTSGCGSALSSQIIDTEVSGTEVSGTEVSGTEVSDTDAFNTKNPKAIFSWDPDEILSKMLEFQRQSNLFHQTGGVHSAALVYDGNIIAHISDIGRHNAVDKVVGKAIEEKRDLTRCYLLSSGRISSEIMRKIVRLKIPLIVSHSAPTSEAVRIGWQYKATIIGFTRNGRFNQYTGFI